MRKFGTESPVTDVVQKFEFFCHARLTVIEDDGEASLCGRM